MDFVAFSKQFAKKIGGEYDEYNENYSIFIIPLKDKRFQTVMARIIHHEKYNKDVVQITSKVCPTTEKINYPEVLEASKDFLYTNFIVEDGFLKVDTSLLLDQSSEDLIEEIIKEVAYTADEWEFKITGKDIY